MTAEIGTRRRVPAARFRPGFAISFAPSLTEGAGKAGRRLRPQHRVQKRNNAHGFVRYSRDIPAFPAQWLYGLYVLSPVSGVFVTVATPAQAGMDRRHGRGARTTRLRRTLRTFRPAGKPALTPQRPSQPAPRFVTTAKRPSGRRGLSGPVPVICPTRQGKYSDFQFTSS